MIKKTCLTAMMFLLLLNSGCIEIKRYVQDNTFHSTMLPTINVKIDDSFEYKDAKKKNYVGDYANEPELAGTQVEQNSFVFKRTDDKTLIKIMIVQINTESYFYPYTMKYKKDILSHGKVGLNDLYYYVFPYGYKDKNNNEVCNLVKTMGKNVSNDDVQFEIFYFKDITSLPGNIYTCKDWTRYENLKDDQKQLLDDFMKKADQDVRFPK